MNTQPFFFVNFLSYKALELYFTDVFFLYFNRWYIHFLYYIVLDFPLYNALLSPGDYDVIIDIYIIPRIKAFIMSMDVKKC